MNSSRHTIEKSSKIPFIVEELIAKSNFQVFKCKSPDSDTKYALKIFPNKDSEVNPFYTRERRAMDFSHPNIISIRDIQSNVKTCSKDGKTKEGVSYILMEYAPHGDLSELIWMNRLPKDDKLIRTIFKFCCEGIAYIHSRGFAHTDLKPENVLIGEGYLPKISDFGSMVDVMSGEEMIVRGSVNHRSPEIESQTCNDPYAADVYSLGVLLVTLQLNQLPYLENYVVEGYDLRKMLEEGDENFWKIQNYVRLPSTETNSFKKLVFEMTTRKVNRRISLEKVMMNEWYRGETYSKQEYWKVMRRIKRNLSIC